MVNKYLDNRNRKKGLFGMAEQVEDPQVNPQIEQPSQPEQPQQAEQSGGFKGLLSKLAGSFKSENVPGEIDPTTGLQKPATEKQGTGRKILNYALPALLSMGMGAGALPGLLMGMGGQSRKRKEERESSSDFEKTKQKAISDIAEQKSLDSYRKSSLDIKGISSAMDKKALDIETRYRKDPNSVSDNDINYLKSYYRQKKTKNADAPEADTVL